MGLFLLLYFVNSYSHLAIVLHSPITSFFVPQINYREANTTSTEFDDYIQSHWHIFEAQKWIIQGLWAFNENNEQMTFCPNSTNKYPKYNQSALDQKFRKKLTAKWPAVTIDTPEDSLWESEFEMYGSCVSEKTLDYFEQAINLSNEFDLEEILRNGDIYPGNVYEIDKCIDVIERIVEQRVYLTCIPAAEAEAQYLLEVQICYDRDHQKIDCNHRADLGNNMHICQRNIPIIYPKVPNEDDEF